MVLIAVLVGYVLGIAPFIYKTIVEKTDKKEATEKQASAEQIFNEWLNGPEKTNQETNIYDEYMTGEVKGE